MQFIRLQNQHGFTLFELIISITIFSMIMISVFDSVANIGIARITSTQRISLLEELYSFSEKLTTTIKEGGTIDYEEYWGRTRVGTDSIGGYGHYVHSTLFGNYGTGGVASSGSSNNFGSGLYYCVSESPTAIMGTGGCSTPMYNSLIDKSSINQDYSIAPQRYGEYKIQFTDYNGNHNSDGGDEDANGNVVGDDDDVDLGDGPTVIDNPMLELYLIDTLKNKRTFFRIVYRPDTEAPTGSTCSPDIGIYDGCVGNVQVLKMSGKDIGINHAGSGVGAFDGKTDTWVCDSDWKCPDGNTLTGSYGVVSLNNDSDWVDLFPDYINIKSLHFYIYPLQNPWLSWKATDDLTTSGFISPFIHPYVRMELTLGFAWKRRSIIKNDDPTITISTTLNLEDYGNE